MAHEKFKYGSEDELRECSCHIRCRPPQFRHRSILEEFHGRQSRKKHVRVYPQSQTPQSLQPLLLEQEFYCANLGMPCLIVFQKDAKCHASYPMMLWLWESQNSDAFKVR